MTAESMEGVGFPSFIEQIEPSPEAVQTVLNEYVANPTFRVKTALTEMESKGQSGLLALMRQNAIVSPHDPSALLKWPIIYWSIISRTAAKDKLTVPILSEDLLRNLASLPDGPAKLYVPEPGQHGWKLFYSTLESAVAEAQVTDVTADCVGKSAQLQRAIEYAVWNLDRPTT